MLQLSQRLGVVPDVLARSPRTTGRLPPEYALFIPMPKRMRRMSSSRGVNGARTRVAVSRRFDWMAASMGKIAFFSSMKSPVGTPVADLLIEGGVPVIFYSGSARSHPESVIPPLLASSCR